MNDGSVRFLSVSSKYSHDVNNACVLLFQNCLKLCKQRLRRQIYLQPSIHFDKQARALPVHPVPYSELIAQNFSPVVCSEREGAHRLLPAKKNRKIQKSFPQGARRTVEVLTTEVFQRNVRRNRAGGILEGIVREGGQEVSDLRRPHKTNTLPYSCHPNRTV